jgi:hypothetical protein
LSTPTNEEDKSEEEDGQIVIPEDVCVNIKDLMSEVFYQVVYIKLKSNEENQTDKEVSMLDI